MAEEGTITPVQALASAPRTQSISEVPAGYVFHPNAHGLLKHYLLRRALDRDTEEPIEGSVADGVDVYALRPEALPLPRRNKSMYSQVWGYFFTTRPTGAAAGGVEGSNEDDIRHVAAGGCWRRYGGDKEYVGKDGEVYGFRRRFAFHEAGVGGKKTVWRMKEFRLKETAPTFRGFVFHPNSKGLVIWKVYNEVIPEEDPAVDYYNTDDDDIGAVAITVGDGAAAPIP